MSLRNLLQLAQCLCTGVERPEPLKSLEFRYIAHKTSVQRFPSPFCQAPLCSTCCFTISTQKCAGEKWSKKIYECSITVENRAQTKEKGAEGRSSGDVFILFYALVHFYRHGMTSTALLFHFRLAIGGLIAESLNFPLQRERGVAKKYAKNIQSYVLRQISR